MLNLRSLAEDKILMLILLGIFGPLVLVALDILLNFLGIKVSITGGIFNYLIYAFGISLFSLTIYVPFFKKTVLPKTNETKALVFIWILVSLIVLVVLAKIYPPLLSTGGRIPPSLSLENIAYLLLILGAILVVIGIPFLILNLIMGKGSPQKRQIITFSVGSFVIASLATATLMYIFKPNRTAIEIYPMDLKGTEFSCSVRMGATLFPKQNLEKNIMETIDGALFTDDKTKMAIEIDGKVLKMLTATSVEVGINKPAELVIVREDENELIAVDPESDILIDKGIGTFVLNRKNGVAVWTKSKPSFFTTALPEAQAYYMECR